MFLDLAQILNNHNHMTRTLQHQPGIFHSLEIYGNPHVHAEGRELDRVLKKYPKKYPETTIFVKFYDFYNRLEEIMIIN